MARIRRRPVAVCPKCQEQTGYPEHIGKRCFRKVDGERCTGRFRGVAEPDDWHECRACSATGWIDGTRCARCAGHGWLLLEAG